MPGTIAWRRRRKNSESSRNFYFFVFVAVGFCAVAEVVGSPVLESDEHGKKSDMERREWGEAFNAIDISL